MSRTSCTRLAKALRRSLALVLLTLGGALTAPAAHANAAAPLSADPALEASVMRIAEELRCLVCQNETIAASQADLAVDLRRQIRTQLAQGRSQDQILDFMVDRYGAFVRYRPAFNPTTLLLWTGPFAMLLLAAFVLMKNIRSRRRMSPGPSMSDADSRQVDAILAGSEMRS